MENVLGFLWAAVWVYDAMPGWFLAGLLVVLAALGFKSLKYSLSA